MCDNHTVTPISSAEELGLRVREARLGVGRSQGDVARALGVDRTSITRVERGERGLSTLELVRLSEFLDLPISFFLERPSEVVTSLRGAVSDDPDQSERARFRADTILDTRLRAAEFLLTAGELPRAMHAPGETTIQSSEDASRMAQEARRALGITGPVPAIQSVCEAFGFYVFSERIGIDGASRSPDKDFGVAIVRDADDPGRRRATAAHELGHHLLGDAYNADFGAAGGSRSEHEQLVDTFAAQFLLPTRDLRRRLRDVKPDDIWNVLVAVSVDYRVSWSLTVRVAVTAGVIDDATGRRLSARTPLRSDMLRITGHTVAQDLTYRSYGTNWTRAVMRAQAQNLITRARAEEYLAGTDPFGAESGS